MLYLLKLTNPKPLTSFMRPIISTSIPDDQPVKGERKVQRVKSLSVSNNCAKVVSMTEIKISAGELSIGYEIGTAGHWSRYDQFYYLLNYFSLKIENLKRFNYDV